VTISYRLVGTILVSGYDEMAVASYETVLNDLTNGTTSGPFQPVHTLRNSAGADLVALLHNRTEFCGVAWLILNPSVSTAANGMSITTLGCITNESFTHETGHNMGWTTTVSWSRRHRRIRSTISASSVSLACFERSWPTPTSALPHR
jgi:hypothetical protein